MTALGLSAQTRVAILISGGGSNMVKLVEHMHSTGHGQPVLVLSNQPDAGGLARAAALNVPAATVDHQDFPKDRNGFERALIAELEAVQAELICLAGFMRVLTPLFVDHFKDRVLNIHPSLLPLYKGLDTHARALAAGDAEHGCTVHRVTAALDDGPVLGQARVPILPADTPETLAARVLPMEHQLYPAVLEALLMGEDLPVHLP